MTAPALPGVKSILVVDDEGTIASLMGLTLESAGYRVAIANDGAEAVRVAHGFHPDLLVTDLHMPRLGGAETMRQIRESQPDLPALLISGDSPEEARAEAPEANAILKKPFSIKALLLAAQGLLTKPGL